MPRLFGTTPTPQRQRSLGSLAAPGLPGQTADSCAGPVEGSKAADVTSVPAELQGLSWPSSFCSCPRGERLALSESDRVATRISGVNQGLAFVGPLPLERGAAYFEVEVLELESNRSQTLAIGVCTSLPSGSSLRLERGRDLGPGSFMLGYDLPKVYAGGAEVGKINTKEWRPLKELVVGSRIGLLVESAAMELTVFCDGVKKAKVSMQQLLKGAAESWPKELWGVVDVHGTVRSVQLQDKSQPYRLRAAAPQSMAVPPTPARWFESALATASTPKTPSVHRRLTSTQDLNGEAAPPLGSVQPKIEEVSARRCPVRAGLEVPPGPKKRLRTLAHPCGCLVHLLPSSGDVIHVPRVGDFVIGRNPLACNLVLDSADAPNMISRRHAVIENDEDAVTIVDCRSTNGTWVNGRMVKKETLRHGDQLVLGTPAQCPPEFRLQVSMPVGL